MIYGFVGAILALGLFAAGAYCGWRMNDKLREKKTVIAEREIGEAERDRLKREQEAFRTMLNYNPDMAYGINVGDYIGQEESEVAS
jgi:hypothetical protein